MKLNNIMNSTCRGTVMFNRQKIETIGVPFVRGLCHCFQFIGDDDIVDAFTLKSLCWGELQDEPVEHLHVGGYPQICRKNSKKEEIGCVDYKKICECAKLS